MRNTTALGSLRWMFEHDADVATALDSMTLAERFERLTTQGARFELRDGEQDHPLIREAISSGVARTFRDGGIWLELAD